MLDIKSSQYVQFYLQDVSYNVESTLAATRIKLVEITALTTNASNDRLTWVSDLSA